MGWGFGWGFEELRDIPLYESLDKFAFGLFGLGSLIDIGYRWGAEIPWEE
jgi:hypothetical protein